MNTKITFGISSPGANQEDEGSLAVVAQSRCPSVDALKSLTRGKRQKESEMDERDPS